MPYDMGLFFRDSSLNELVNNSGGYSLNVQGKEYKWVNKEIWFYLKLFIEQNIYTCPRDRQTLYVEKDKCIVCPTCGWGGFIRGAEYVFTSGVMKYINKPEPPRLNYIVHNNVIMCEDQFLLGQTIPSVLQDIWTVNKIYTELFSTINSYKMYQGTDGENSRVVKVEGRNLIYFKPSTPTTLDVGHHFLVKWRDMYGLFAPPAWNTYAEHFRLFLNVGKNKKYCVDVDLGELLAKHNPFLPIIATPVEVSKQIDSILANWNPKVRVSLAKKGII